MNLWIIGGLAANLVFMVVVLIAIGGIYRQIDQLETECDCGCEGTDDEPDVVQTAIEAGW